MCLMWCMFQMQRVRMKKRVLQNQTTGEVQLPLWRRNHGENIIIMMCCTTMWSIYKHKYGDCVCKSFWNSALTNLMCLILFQGGRIRWVFWRHVSLSLGKEDPKESHSYISFYVYIFFFLEEEEDVVWFVIIIVFYIYTFYWSSFK